MHAVGINDLVLPNRPDGQIGGDGLALPVVIGTQPHIGQDAFVVGDRDGSNSYNFV